MAARATDKKRHSAVLLLTRASQYDGIGWSQPTDAYLRVIAKGLAEVHPGVNAGEYMVHAVGNATQVIGLQTENKHLNVLSNQ